MVTCWQTTCSDESIRVQLYKKIDSVFSLEKYPCNVAAENKLNFTCNCYVEAGKRPLRVGTGFAEPKQNCPKKKKENYMSNSKKNIYWDYFHVFILLELLLFLFSHNNN